MNDKGDTPRSQDDQGLMYESGYAGSQQRARPSIPYVLWFLFAPFSPFQSRSEWVATESGYEPRQVWRRTDFRSFLVAVAEHPRLVELLLAAWIVGSFLFVLPAVMAFIFTVLMTVLPKPIALHPLVLVAVVVCVGMGMCVIGPLYVWRWLANSLWKAIVRDADGLEGGVPDFPYSYGGGDGSSLDQAIVMRGEVYDPRSFVVARLWTTARYGEYVKDWTLVSRRRFTDGQRDMKEWVIRLATGEKKTIYFEVALTPKQRRRTQLL
jgi:hypothetical protein